ncbi:MAG: pyridoxal phosphate-dependent aminotransferase [Candidatus Acidiferrales bacterium]
MAQSATAAGGTLHLSDRVGRIEISATLKVILEAEKYRARGIDVVDFGPGEPDFPTPDHIKRAAIRALDENRTKYTPTGGITPLRKAICDWHQAQLGSSYEPAESIVSVGGKHVIFNTVNALINRGDEVLIPAPYWVSYPDIVKCVNGTPVYVHTDPNDGFRLRSEQVEKAITSRTRLLIVNSPSNPTGAVVSPEEFAHILDVCKRHKIWLLSDECYSHFTYGDAKPFSIASIPGSKDHVIIAGSLSKTFAMTGWRIGYALAPKPLIEAMLKLQSQSTSNPTSIAQYAALQALTGPMDSVATMLAEYARRRARIVAGLRAIPGMRCAAPDGAFYAFPSVVNCKKHNGAAGLASTGEIDTASVTKQLLEEQHVLVVPGEAFGAPGFLRISYATSMERIEEGLRRFSRFFGGDE